MTKKLLIIIIIVVLGIILIQFLVLNKYWNDKPFSSSHEESFVVSTFNIEWLGDGINDRIKRSEKDYQNIAKIIQMINADIFGLQEIENKAALHRIIKYLDGYQYIIFDNWGKQNVACLYKSGVEIFNSYLYYPLSLDSRFLRPGLVIEGRKGNFDWIIKIVHLKSSSRFDTTAEMVQRSIELRSNQVMIIRYWLDSVYNSSNEQDIIIIGDFNDSPKKRETTLTPLLEYEQITFLTDELKSCKNPYWNMIDHIVVTHSAKNRYISGSLWQYNFHQSLTVKESEKVSDHCPVIVAFEIKSPDND